MAEFSIRGVWQEGGGGGGGVAQFFELSCLQPAFKTTVILLEIPEHLPRDNAFLPNLALLLVL